VVPGLIPEVAPRNIAGHHSISGSWPGYRGRVPDTGWTEVVALAAAYFIALVTTPAGISGAVLLLPFQVSVLATPSPAVTPTNLLYNVVATPGALYRYWRQGQTGGRLALVLIAGTLPGVIAGSVIRVKLIPGPHVFALVVAGPGGLSARGGATRVPARARCASTPSPAPGTPTTAPAAPAAWRDQVIHRCRPLAEQVLRGVSHRGQVGQRRPYQFSARTGGAMRRLGGAIGSAYGRAAVL
jgi:Sulfite exporter TauE/SafE